MTKPRYPLGCSARSKVHGHALPPSGNAWNVNLNNGNANYWNQSNHNCALACRPGECQDAASFRSLHTAWRRASRGKKPSRDQLRFECSRISKLLQLEREIGAGTWCPSPPTCFIATAPKAREIHAPTFADRVVHQWLVPPLERLYEPLFIHDSYSNRIGKGTHAAVRRLEFFARQVASGQGGGYYLQLDVRNFFNSIHRPTLWALLKPRMERARMCPQIRRTVHALLIHPISRTGVAWACTAAEREAVPAHKRLENAPPGCGIAIGNLSSQFFANVYLDQLDQFAKHQLKARRYLRYVDDFVLVHESQQQLREWHDQIEAFLRDRLRLELKADQRLRPLHEGIDFLGYIVRPSHTVVRRRVVAHCRAKLASFELDPSSATTELVRATWASYEGHFRHARSFRLRQRIHNRFPWLGQALSRSH